jgi:hypothetical protein
MKVVWRKTLGLDHSSGVRRLGLGFIISCMAWACEPMESEYAPQPTLDVSPAPGPAMPPSDVLKAAEKSLEAGQSREVVRMLHNLKVDSPLEKAWHRLLLGEAYFDIGAMDRAHQLLLANYEELRDARPTLDPEVMRILARSLKKLGITWRDRRDYEKAYTLHQLQWLYMRRVGNLSERFDALISLDVDAALLRNYFASEQWLREALLVAQQMPEGLDKQRAQILIWNNLSLTLSELLRFPEAEAAIRESRRIAQLYDAASPSQEYREIWAIAQQAEVYGAWARYTEAKNPAESRPLHARAQAFAIEALALADKLEMGRGSLGKLEQQMRRYCGSHCRPGAA